MPTTVKLCSKTVYTVSCGLACDLQIHVANQLQYTAENNVFWIEIKPIDTFTSINDCSVLILYARVYLYSSEIQLLHAMPVFVIVLVSSKHRY